MLVHRHQWQPEQQLVLDQRCQIEALLEHQQVLIAVLVLGQRGSLAGDEAEPAVDLDRLRIGRQAALADLRHLGTRLQVQPELGLGRDTPADLGRELAERLAPFGTRAPAHRSEPGCQLGQALGQALEDGQRRLAGQGFGFLRTGAQVDGSRERGSVHVGSGEILSADSTARSIRPAYTGGMKIADLRKSYERAELNEHASHADPMQQFDQWLHEAIQGEIPEPNAMTVATVGSDLRPSTRVVLIKGYDERGIVWYTNYDSRKGRELAGNPFAALQFHWVELERVVRIEGRVERVSEEESDAYFHSRPLDSRIGAWASPQSQVIPSRTLLVANAAKYAAQFLLNPPRPAHWGGLRLVPERWEFWQGRKSRLHDRLRYSQVADGWLRERLAP